MARRGGRCGWLGRLPSGRSTSWLFVLASFLNVSFCVVGGLLLYLDSIAQIEDGVEELSEAELQHNGDRLSRSFADVYWMTKLYAHQLYANGTKLMSDVDTLQDFYVTLQLSTLVHSDSMYSISVLISPQGADSIYDPEGMLQVTWWDPLTDPTTIQKYGRDRVWISGTYLPQYYNSSSCRNDPIEYPPTRRRCVVCYSVDPYGRRLENVYNYSDKNIYRLQSGTSEHWELATQGWEDGGASFWRSLSVWESEDGTKYGYATFARVLPRMGGLFTGAKVALMTYVSFYGWFDRIEESEATMMATTMANGLNSQILASNIDLEYLHRDCQSNRKSGERGRAFCLYTLSELPASFQDAALILNVTAYNAFRSATLDGERYWVRRVSIFASRDIDLLDSIDLLWMRKHSTVQDKVKRALIQAVCFAVGAAALSGIVLVLLVVGISIPLHKVTSAMQLLDSMELERAAATLPPIRKLQVIEVSKLIASARAAIESLKMYRDFIPQSCLQMGGGARESDGEDASFGKARQSVGSASVSMVNSMHRHASQSSVGASCSSKGSFRDGDLGHNLRAALSAELEQRLVTVAVINTVNFHSEEGAVGRHKQLLAAVLQSKADGVVDGCFGDRCRVSWNGPRTVANQRTRAAVFVETMRASTTQNVLLSGNNRLRSTLSMAATTGPAKCGVAGCEGVRYFTIVSKHVSFAFLLERLARKEAAYRGASVGLVTRIIKEDVGLSVNCKFYMQSRCRKSRIITALFETTGLVDECEPNEEWMYIIGESENGVWSVYNEAAKLATLGSIDSAVRILEERIKARTNGTREERAHTDLLVALVKGQDDDSVLPTRIQDMSDEPVAAHSGRQQDHGDQRAEVVTEM